MHIYCDKRINLACAASVSGVSFTLLMHTLRSRYPHEESDHENEEILGHLIQRVQNTVKHLKFIQIRWIQNRLSGSSTLLVFVSMVVKRS